MKIAQKLVGSFIGVSLLTGMVGAVGIIQNHRIAETLAIVEAEHVAQSISTAISYHATTHGEVVFSDELQPYVRLLHELQQRDIEVVNQQKKIVADVFVEDIGTTFTHDTGNEVRQTMQDGITRSFLEKSDDYPEGVRLIVVPLRDHQNKIAGAVILEWSSIYKSAIAEAQPIVLVIGFTSIGCVLLALFVGWYISRSIAKPLKAATEVAQQVTEASNFDLQVPVTTQDETGTVAIALNHLIQRVKTLLHEKEQHSEELHYALKQLHKTQLQLVQTEKMSSLGQLVAGVAHEINNPVNFIHGNVTHIDNYAQDLLKVIRAYRTHYPHPPQSLKAVLDDVELDFLHEDMVKLLHSMRLGTDRIRAIVLSLRNFSRLDEAERKAVDIHEGIDNTLVILHHRLKANSERPEIKIIKKYSPLPLVECYAGQLNQVFMNILSNAIEAFEDFNRGKTFEELEANPNTIQICTYITNDDQVAITITDNGPGMSEQVRSHLFVPFFTTKPVGKGTGLGLSISYQIVTDKHGGHLWCDSTPNQGTKFVIQIPMQQQFVQAA